MRKIYIVGCGRSGTTLMRHLFDCFKGCFVVRPESDYSVFENYAEKSTSFDYIAAKRKAITWKTLHLLPSEVYVVAMIRHPFDVMTSYLKGSKKPDEFYIPPDRWINETRALLALEQARNSERMIFVRYEDLVSKPDSVQKIIEDFSGISSESEFSSARPISTASVEKFRKNDDFRLYCEQLLVDYGGDIMPFCDRFGYNYKLE